MILERSSSVIRGLSPAPGQSLRESVYPFAIEAMEALAYGLRMTSELLGDPGRAQPPPAQRDDPGTEDPVSRSVAACGELVDFPFFLGVFGHPGVKQFRHVLLSFLSAVRPRAYVYRL
jgi:hypothetical protein